MHTWRITRYSIPIYLYITYFYILLCEERSLRQGPEDSGCFEGYLSFKASGHQSLFPSSGRSAVVTQHRGDWKWMKECWDLKAYYHWKSTFACHQCIAQHRGPDSNLALDHDQTQFSSDSFGGNQIL